MGRQRRSDDRGELHSRERVGYISRIRDDLLRGENIELYITVGLSLIVAVLGILDKVDTKVVSASTLAVLALLAVSGLSSRHNIDRVESSVRSLHQELRGDLPADRFLLRKMTISEDQTATAMELCLVGVTLTRTVRDLLPILDRRLRKGASVRIVVLDDNSTARNEAVARSLGANDPSFYEHRLSSTIDLLSALAQMVPEARGLQLRLLPFVPTFGMCLIDPSERHGLLYVEMYLHKSVEEDPSFTLRADRDGERYQLFLRQFETLWENAKPLPLPIDRTGTLR